MDAPVTVYDNLLAAESQSAIWEFLNRPGWVFGAFSSEAGERYLYKHYAGFVSGRETLTSAAIEQELDAAAPLIGGLWRHLKSGALANHELTRCYANGMAPGVEGDLHCDSQIPGHRTAIYYAHPAWNPDFGGETLVFNESRDEVIAAVYPKPNRLAIFDGVRPHVARPMSKRCEGLRITLMFKTRPA
jgi:SM-20-related protein